MVVAALVVSPPVTADPMTGKFCNPFGPASASRGSLAVTPSPPRSTPSPPAVAKTLFPTTRADPLNTVTPPPWLKAMTFASPGPVPPTVVPVGPPDGQLRVACRKPGFRDSEVLYSPSPYSYAGNPNVGIGVGGGSSAGVGVGFGFNFPVGGGAGPVGGYPSRITVEMTPQ